MHDTKAQPLPSRRRRMPRRRTAFLIALAFVLVAGLLGIASGLIQALFQRAQVHVEHMFTGPTTVHLPQGFHIATYADGLENPRFFTFGPAGTLYATERSGDIVALAGMDTHGKAARRIIIASGFFDPTSVVYAGGALYIGEQTRVTKLTLSPGGGVARRDVLVDDLPKGGSHVTRTVLLGADGKLYVSIGSDCNNCVESEPHRATVWQYNADGSGGHVYVRGLRNAVGMATNPWTHEIWVTNNGRDLMGDDTPPDTIYALRDGANYGWPRCQAGDIIDPDLGHPGDCNGVEQPLVKMQAHSAPLGLTFYNPATAPSGHDGEQPFPASYRGFFVAYHGSWNRTIPTGYKVVFIPLDSSGHVAGPPSDFATGWLMNAAVNGRPVGVAFGPDGALYVSDDKTGMIYRIWYQP